VDILCQHLHHLHPPTSPLTLSRGKKPRNSGLEVESFRSFKLFFDAEPNPIFFLERSGITNGMTGSHQKFCWEFPVAESEATPKLEMNTMLYLSCLPFKDGV